jgi:predicted DsbA family dithiol-disulfide isomerase
VYGDYVCPFSYIGDARLRRLAEAESLEIRWRPFELHPALPAEGLPVREAGYPPDEWSDAVQKLEAMAMGLDLPFHVPDFVANSHLALQVGEFARDLGAEAHRAVHAALYRAYFVEGRNLGRREDVLDVAESAGLDREAVERALEDGRYEDELERATAEAERYEITGTPTFLFGRFKVVGAAPLSVMRDACRRARDAEQGVDDADRGAGDVDPGAGTAGGNDDGGGRA